MQIDKKRKAPESRGWTVSKLVSSASAGDIRVPKFQRGLRWDAGDVRQLFDSIKHGYPIGTLLLWRRPDPAPAAMVEFGPVRFNAPQASNALWVVDGQQRTTALVAALLHPAPDPKHAADEYEFHYDLEAETFVRRATRRIPPETWVPLWELLDTSQLMSWVRAKSPALPPELEARAFALGAAIREYELPSVIVESADEKELREIFKRINNAGRRLSQNEVFHALYLPDDGETPSTLNELAGALADLEFGNLELLPFRQIVLAMRDIEPTRSVKDINFSHKRFAGAVAEATGATRRAIVFLKKDAGIPVAQLVPYAAFFVVLARFFQRFPEPNSRSRDLLARWIWRSTIAGTLRGEVSEIRASFFAIDSGEEESVQKLLKLVQRPPTVSMTGDFDFRSSVGKVVALALFERAPRDLESGLPLEPHRLFNEAGTRPFHRLVLRQISPNFSRLAMGNHFVVANDDRRSIHGKIWSAIRANRTEALLSHMMDAESIRAFEADDMTQVVERRTEKIAAAAAALAERRAKWGAIDRPSLAFLSAIDDEDDDAARDLPELH